MILVKDLLYGFVAMFGSLLSGVSMGFSSPVLRELEKKWEISDSEKYWFNSITTLIGIFVPFLYSFILSKVGRKIVYFSICFFSFLTYSCFLAVTEKRFWLAILLRACVGIQLGGYSTLCPVLLIEFASPKSTGFFGNLHQIGIVVGIALMYLLCMLFDWKVLCYVSLGVSLIGCIIIFFVPETNHYSKDGAEKLLIERNVHKIVVSVGIMILQQFSGIGCILNNLDEDLRSAGVSFRPEIASVVTMGLQLVGVILCGFFIDRLGRRVLFCGSSIGCGVILIVYSTILQYSNVGWLPFFFVATYLFFFGLALGPLPWFIAPEMFQNKWSISAAACVTSSNQIGSLIVGYIFPKTKELVGLRTGCIMFGTLCIVTALYGMKSLDDDIFVIKTGKIVWFSDSEDDYINSNTNI
ncbi:Major Facilitator Superfamily protein [Trichomonas vaginalis G3]|uniref:Major Facilitator Superfamily protein n=1 Tax=Trichomonas vaginalis (strain ATCC PRA-98 / G3) TaxID=412133 RepID=A2ESE9_TRIV3|nr:major facilitator superfamily transporter [Trichomonas vaginalis G3]EAY04393.1 Major Facilitator Superfamily protein [Trichomonas vaginalis G3]KAI5526350.1 glucose import [Trichomonas vaginalis G3]|eukprot:XP_001316616.1 major facilitator superfamily transporter [Trichomonas vaginalis G3]